MLKYGGVSKIVLRMFSTNYKIEPINLNEKGEVLKFMRSHFVQDEPLCNSLNMLKSEGDKSVGMDYNISSLIEKGETYKIEDSGKIIAVGLFSLVNKEKDPKGLDVVNDPPYQKIYDLLSFIESKVDVLKQFNIDKYYFTDFVGVHKDYRKLGLHRLLKHHSEKRAKSLGCKYLASLTTGAYSKRGCANFGMKEVFSLKYADYKVNGEIVFNTAPPHLEAVYHIKCLS